MRFKLSDFAAVLYLVAFTAFLFFETALFISLTKAHPILMGFLKFGFLATFGECLKNRLGSKKKWIPDKIMARFLVWGLFGIWITLAFPYADGGVTSLVSGGLWPKASALSKSLWINLFGGYAFFMMYIHYWCDTMLAKGWCWPWAVLGPEAKQWAKVIMISMVGFWVPAHWFTFSQPPEFRVIIAAYLSIALGFILSFAARRRS